MHGHTLVEMLLVIAIASIVCAIALPSFSGLLAEQRRVTTVNGLVTALNHARHASVYLSRPARVCPDGGTRCGEDWAAGWLVFVEPRDWRAGQPVPESAVLYHFAPASPAMRVAANRTSFRFRPNRRRATNGTLVICEPGRQGRAVVVAPSGRVRTSAALPGWADDNCGEAARRP